jgi:hypothetical protein
MLLKRPLPGIHLPGFFLPTDIAPLVRPRGNGQHDQMLLKSLNISAARCALLYSAFVLNGS